MTTIQPRMTEKIQDHSNAGQGWQIYGAIYPRRGIQVSSGQRWIHAWHIVKQLNVIRNKVLRWLSIYFPEYRTVFGDWEGKAALIVLKEFPLTQADN